MRNLSRALPYVCNLLVVAAACWIHSMQHHYSVIDARRLTMSAGYAAVLSLASYAVGLPDLVNDRRGALASAFVAVAAAALGVSAVQLFVGDALLPRAVVFGSAALLVPLYAMAARLATGARDRARQRDAVFFIGDIDEASLLRADMTRNPERPSALVGWRGVSDLRRSDEVTAPLEAAVRDAGASVLVLAREAQLDEDIVHQAAALHIRGLRVRTLSLFYEQWLGKLPVAELERVSLMFDISEIHRAVYSRMSRLLDVSVSAVGVLGLGVVLPAVAIGNAVANRGPLFYRQPRIGKNGQPFSILKLRTMAGSDAIAEESSWTSEQDPRVTPFGAILRRTHVDELPQFLNVLRGELSVVGPRPEQPHYVSQLAAKLPFYDFRHLVRPGMTGWAQVMYGYAGNEADALEKLQYEFFYLRHQSLVLDIRILIRTLRSVVGAKGR